MSRFTVEKHYGEWMLSRWYDNIPGPERLVEISTSLSEEDAFNLVSAWSKKLLTPGLDPERLNSITESLISSHWNQACRMGCLAVQFTYINGFYHRFVWRVAWALKLILDFEGSLSCIKDIKRLWFSWRAGQDNLVDSLSCWKSTDLAGRRLICNTVMLPWKVWNDSCVIRALSWWTIARYFI